MIVRSEHVLTALLPAIAVIWVITDATMGPVVADRIIAAGTSAVHITSTDETSITVEAQLSDATMTICSLTSNIAPGTVSIDHTQTTLERLCQARLKFTSSLPRT
jgi:hypothetical protein